MFFHDKGLDITILFDNPVDLRGLVSCLNVVDDISIIVLASSASPYLWQNAVMIYVIAWVPKECRAIPKNLKKQ